MKYIVQCKMMSDLTPSSPLVVRHAVLCRLLRGAAWIIAPIAYLGLLAAPAGLLSFPFQVFHRTHVPPLVYWVTASTIGALITWVLYRLARFSYRSFRNGVIDLEAVVGFVGFALAVPVIIWIYPPK